MFNLLVLESSSTELLASGLSAIFIRHGTVACSSEINITRGVL